MQTLNMLVKDCPSPLALGMTLGLIILAIIILGIIILCIVRCCFTIYDRREYARFEKELEKSKWEMVKK